MIPGCICAGPSGRKGESDLAPAPQTFPSSEETGVTCAIGVPWGTWMTSQRSLLRRLTKSGNRVSVARPRPRMCFPLPQGSSPNERGRDGLMFIHQPHCGSPDTSLQGLNPHPLPTRNHTVLLGWALPHYLFRPRALCVEEKAQPSIRPDTALSLSPVGLGTASDVQEASSYP